MAQKYGEMANAHRRDEFVCQVCETKNPRFTWSDQHGEGMCTTCGVPYQLIHYEDGKHVEKSPAINLADKWIPTFQRYWRETRQFTGAGAIMIARDYPECVRGMQKFHAWLGKNPDAKPTPEEPSELTA